MLEDVSDLISLSTNASSMMSMVLGKSRRASGIINATILCFIYVSFVVLNDSRLYFDLE